MKTAMPKFIRFLIVYSIGVAFITIGFCKYYYRGQEAHKVIHDTVIMNTPVLVHDTIYLGKVKQEWYYKGKLMHTEIEEGPWTEHFPDDNERSLNRGRYYLCDKVKNTFVY